MVSRNSVIGGRILDLKEKYEAREKALRAMKKSQVAAIAFDYRLPQDLNTEERVKYILLREFPVR